MSTPSMQDFEVTYKLENSANLLGIKLLDHIVIGKSEYTSIMSIKDWKLQINKVDMYTNCERIKLEGESRM